MFGIPKADDPIKDPKLLIFVAAIIVAFGSPVSSGFPTPTKKPNQKQQYVLALTDYSAVNRILLVLSNLVFGLGV